MFNAFVPNITIDSIKTCDRIISVCRLGAIKATPRKMRSKFCYRYTIKLMFENVIRALL